MAKTLPWKAAALRGTLGAVQSVSPGAAGWLADRMFCTPPTSRVPSTARAVLAGAKRSSVVSGGRRVAAWRWGEGPAVALMHGWGSRAARLAVHVPALLERGFSVVAFDAPAHGESEGTLGSGLQAARALLDLARSVPLYGAIGHSLGAAATLIALDGGLKLERAVLISPPSDISSYADRFADVFALTPAAYRAMRQRTEARLDFRWDDFNLVTMASRRSEPVLLVHDRQDDEVTWDNGARLAAAWRGATIVSTEGLGHHKIAHDAGVVLRAADFLAAAERRGPPIA